MTNKSPIDEYRRTCHDCGRVFKSLGDKRKHRRDLGKNKKGYKKAKKANMKIPKSRFPDAYWVNYQIETKIFQKSNPDNFVITEGVGARLHPVKPEEEVIAHSQKTARHNHAVFIAGLGDDYDITTTVYHSDMDFMKEEGITDFLETRNA